MGATPQAVRAIHRSEAKSRRLYLTFDDGPDGQFTPAILDILDFYHVLATFFCIGQQVAAFPTVLKRMFDSGHTIGNHTWDHPYLTRVTDAEVMGQLERTSQCIEAVIGTRPLLFRPPYGDVDNRISTEISRMGYRIVMWDVDAVDWSGIKGPEIVSNVIPFLRDESILLHHSAGNVEGTVDALPYIIETAWKMGYRFGPIGERVGHEVYRKL